MIQDIAAAKDPGTLWSEAVESLRGELPGPMHQMLADLMRPVELRDRLLILEAPSTLLRDMLKGPTHEALERALRRLVGDQDFSLLIRPSESPSPREIPPQFLPAEPDGHAASLPPARKATLNPRYLFERFVIGNSNKFAFSAAQAVAQDPGRAYNPLILWGGVGLGKTHLLHAIGHAVAQKDPSARVQCVNSETFVNDYVRALSERKMIEFKARYRESHLLLVDDIQFLEGKEATQEEFFHTFNELAESRRQIVATSDRHPSELSRLEDRLRSRMQMGLVVDIGQPDFELRLAILRTKARADGVSLPDEVALYLAEAREANIRELEGDFTTVVAYASMHQTLLTVETAQAALRGRLAGESRKITPDAIQREAARHFGVQLPDMKSQARTAELVRARQVAMYLCRQLVPNISLSEIGSRFGGRDHTTVLHSIEKIQSLNESDSSFSEDLQRLSKQVRALA